MISFSLFCRWSGQHPRMLSHCCLMESDSIMHVETAVPPQAKQTCSEPSAQWCPSMQFSLQQLYVVSACSTIYNASHPSLHGPTVLCVCSITLTLPDTKAPCMACKKSQKVTLIWSLALHDMPSDKVTWLKQYMFMIQNDTEMMRIVNCNSWG